MDSKQFKANRKALSLTQKQLANQLGLSPKNGNNYIRMIEKGKREPSGVLIRCFELFIEKEYKKGLIIKRISDTY